MAANSATSFDKVAPVFADYGTTLRGHIRYKLTHQNLEPFTRGRKLRVLDVGGGNGPDAGWLAKQGHTVTLLEPSSAQSDYARRRFNFFLPALARKRITIVEKPLAKFTDKQPYDLLLIHGVALYQADPAAFIGRAASHVRTGGLISLVEKGYHGAEARAIHHKDFKDLRRIRRSKRSQDSFGQKVRIFSPQDLENMLQKQAKADVLQWSGIRVLSDDLNSKITEFTHADLNLILKVEAEQGNHPAIRAQGQLLHFIARKR